MKQGNVIWMKKFFKFNKNSLNSKKMNKQKYCKSIRNNILIFIYINNNVYMVNWLQLLNDTNKVSFYFSK